MFKLIIRQYISIACLAFEAAFIFLVQVQLRAKVQVQPNQGSNT